MGILYKETAERIKEYIKGMPKDQAKLPSERELCELLKVSRQTVRHALDFCEEAGMIDRRRGSGIYLSDSYQKSRNRVAILVPDREEYLYPSLIHELEDKFSECMYSAAVFETGDNSVRLEQILNRLYKEPVSVIVIAAVRNALPLPCEDLIKKLKSIGSVIIFIGNPYPNLKDCSYVKSDNYFAGYSIAARVVAQGKPWCALFMHDNLSSYDKYLGLCQSLSELSIEYSAGNIRWFSYEAYLLMDRSNNLSFFEELLNSFETVPGVFVCDNDAIAYWLLKAIEKADIPSDEITVFSFDKSYIQNILEHNLYSFGTDLSLMASNVVLLATSHKKEKEVITLPSSL